MVLEKRLKTSKDLLSEISCDSDHINTEVLEHVLSLAVEIAREGREGKKIGTMFIISNPDEVLEQSWCLILDPLSGHSADKRRIDDYNMRETVKELAQLDGAFIVSSDGVVITACRYINACADGVDLPLGLGSRHMAAASITKKQTLWQWWFLKVLWFAFLRVERSLAKPFRSFQVSRGSL